MRVVGCSVVSFVRSFVRSFVVSFNLKFLLVVVFLGSASQADR